MDVSASADDHPHLAPLIEAAQENIDDERDVVTVADAGYHLGANLAACNAGGHTVLMPTTHERRRRNPYHKDHFTYRPETDTYLCPQQKVLTYTHSLTHSNGYRVKRYQANGRDCSACPAFGVCTCSQRGRSIKISAYEPILQRHRQLLATAPAKQLYRRRSTIVEPVFGLLKEWHSARRFLLRGRSQVAAAWHLLATAFNLKSLHAVWRSGFSPTPPQGQVCHLHRFVHTTRHLTASITQTTVPRTKIMRQPLGEREPEPLRFHLVPHSAPSPSRRPLHNPCRREKVPSPSRERAGVRVNLYRNQPNFACSSELRKALLGDEGSANGKCGADERARHGGNRGLRKGSRYCKGDWSGSGCKRSAAR